MALRVASAYRTVSTEAALVIAGMIPIDILAEERRELAKAGGAREGNPKVERKKTMRKWQQRWDTADCGEWTRSLIGDIETWTGRKFGGINYFVTQFLSGHGSFGNFLERIKKRDNNKCIYCDEIDSPQHMLRECQRWAEQRRTMEEEIGESVTTENVVKGALQTAKS
ncbi:hypothetical protein NQ317_003009 [Molorchus minor]|uniref:Reverse transcriptase n=1 Tax=Molorchus minor TaxID=1323400 RepID=A0ABQ9ISR9_9CUCU|nr:hypothetical protein NQ317_003009 [Molorchus minor]